MAKKPDQLAKNPAKPKKALTRKAPASKAPAKKAPAKKSPAKKPAIRKVLPKKSPATAAPPKVKSRSKEAESSAKSEVSALAPLPEAYEATRFVVLVRDPRSLFAYWEISMTDRARMGWDSNPGLRPMILRALKLGNGPREKNAPPSSFFDLDVQFDPRVGGRAYIELPEAGASWLVELGFRDPAGRFVQLGRYGPLATPRDAVADEGAVSLYNWLEQRPEAVSPMPEDSTIAVSVHTDTLGDIYRLSGGAPAPMEKVVLPLADAASPSGEIPAPAAKPMRVKHLGSSDLTSPG